MARNPQGQRHLQLVPQPADQPPAGGRPKRRIAPGVLAAALLLGGGAAAWWFWLSSAPATTALVEGTVEVSVQADALVVRKEQVYTAPAAGQVRRLVPEGQRVRTGTHVVSLVEGAGGAGAELEVESPGILSYQVDGLEGKLDPDWVQDWTPSWFQSLARPDPHPVGEGTVAEGAPLFKITDNVQLGMVTVVPASKLPHVRQGDSVELSLVGWKRGGVGSGRLSAEIMRVTREGDDVLLYLTAPLMPDRLIAVRQVKVTIVVGRYTGMLVPASAVDVKDGYQGVWVMETDGPVFHRVRVIGGNREQYALDTDLPSGTHVLQSIPSHVH